MKKIICFLLLTFQMSFAQNNAFEQANVLYKSGNYTEAVATYQNILETKKHAPQLYFNIGNCYFKLNKIAPAMYFYQKTLLLDPKFEAAKNNIVIARKLLIDDIKETPKVGFEKWFLDATNVVHYNTWAWISVGLSILFLLFFCLYFFASNTIVKRMFFTTMAITFLLILISISAGFYQKTTIENTKIAIIFAEKTLLKKESNAKSKTVLELHEGTKVFILGSKNGFKNVKLTDGTLGWMSNDDVKEVK